MERRIPHGPVLSSPITSIFFPCFHMLRVIIILLVITQNTHSQTIRTIPPLFNAALEKSVTTNPSASTCGMVERNAYCLSSTNVDSVNRCIQGYCLETCPGRTELPQDSNMLAATSPGSGTCTGPDTVNVRPNTPSGEFSTSISSSGPACYLTPRTSPRVDASGSVSFTISSWVWLDSQVKGTLIEKQASDGSFLYSLRVGTTGISLLYGGVGEDVIPVPVDVAITFQQWTHITLQVHGVSASVYVNGPNDLLAATATVTLVSTVPDNDGTFRVGQSYDGTSQFIGRIQDLRFFSVALSNREIAELYSGTFPAVRIQSQCRCQGIYPRVKPKQTHYCIKNNALATTDDTTLRIARNAHPLQYVNDGDSNSMWISTFLNEVEIDIDLGDQFQVFYVVLQFYSPLPKAVTILRQKDDASPFEVWQYYADDCNNRFGLDNNGAYATPDSINCLQFGTNGAPIPYSLGNITFNLLAPDPVARPGSDDFYNTPELHEFVKAKKVRVKFEDHYYVTNVRHQYYAVYEYIVTAWCDCNGHDSQCNRTTLPYTCQCVESSNTDGVRCEKCKPLFNNKPYRKGDNLNDYPCQACTCYDHADSCVYNATLDPFPDSHDQGGGGVCVNCQHFTSGRFCDSCVEYYYRPNGVSLYDLDVCQPCNCFSSGITNGDIDCARVGGQCSCKIHVRGRTCDSCAPEYYGLTAANADGCLPCGCNALGVIGGDKTCNQTSGQCKCKTNVIGVYCDACQPGFFNLTEINPDGCSPCNCNPSGSSSVNCNPADGQCPCKDRVEGVKCNQCKDGFFNFSSGCVPCNCNPQGTEAGSVCDKITGQCICKRNVEGINCNQCKENTFNFGSSTTFGCESCTCFEAGTVNGTSTCDSLTGDCNCKPNIEGQECNRCKPNTWGLNETDPLGCQPCDCDPTGTLLETTTVCDQNSGQCSCLTNRQGRRCDSCIRGFYNNPDGGCLPCQCLQTGTLPGTVCNSTSGQCECKEEESGVGGKICNECIQTYYGFNARLGTCQPCNCLEAGSRDTVCDATGQCECKQNVEGKMCDQCKASTSQLDPQNPLGCSTDPAQQPPPDNKFKTSTTIYLEWGEPDYPNGIISEYRLIRNNTVIATQNASDRSYNDTDLQPFTYYSYAVEARNAAGSTRSPEVIYQTNAGKPTDDMVLTVTDVRARSVICSWTPPSNMNGPLDRYYILSVKGVSNITKQEWNGTVLTALITGLSPYTRYTLIVRACTVGGCGDSDGVEIITTSAPPEGQNPPVITALSSSVLHVSWEPPMLPNGVITFYELWFRGPRDADGNYRPAQMRIFHPSGRYDPLTPPEENPLSPPATSYNVTGLLAFTLYEFQVLSENDAGKTASIWASGRTSEAVPISIDPPTIRGLSSTELSVSWMTPSPEAIQGVVQIYRLYQNIPVNSTQDPFGPLRTWNLVFEGDGTNFSHQINGLTPYSEHSFILEACNGRGCINSTAVVSRTLIAAPEGVQKPFVDGYNTTAMEIKWDEPLFPNGPPPQYRVQKTNIALSFPASVVRGTRFTGGGYYEFPPSVIPQNVAFTGIRFRFRLDRGTGILLFTASSTQQEFVAVQFVNGRPRLLFDTQGNCGAVSVVDSDSYTNWTNLIDNNFHMLEIRRNGQNGYLLVDNYFRGCQQIAFVTTTNDEGLVYNDRKWHTFEARRLGTSGTVTVDEIWQGQSNIRDPTCTDTSIIGPTTAVYVGGFPSDYVVRRTDSTRRVETEALQGCIDRVEILQQLYPEEVWKSLDWTQGVTNDLAFLNWQGCPINLTPAFHFMGKGYLVLTNCNTRSCTASGNQFQIRFRMRTALHTGFLFLVYGGNGIYIYSVLDNGKVRFVISDNTVRSVVTYDDPDVNFCDGKWRALTFNKTGQQVTISVSQQKTFSFGDPNIAMDLPLTSNIFLGGLKPDSVAATYVKSNGILIPDEGFGGCIADFKIQDVDFAKDGTVVDIANTNLDGCPPYHEPDDICQSSLITEVYEGEDTVAYDTGLLPYTDYIYRVVATNDAGSGFSSWSYGRTREGAPSGVNAPTSVRPITGNEIEVIWDEPDITYGLLTKFVIMAYVVDDQSTFVSMDINDVTVTAANMTGVIPDTRYLVKVRACTPGGCSESQDGLEVTTPIEAPEEVPAPTAETGPSFLFLKWEPPAKPNGPITGYFLYQDGRTIYNGGQLSFNVTGLQVYTAYNFYISACTSTGCTEGPTVSLSTSQLPPTSVGQPRLLALGTSRINVEWDTPTQLNGVLDSYHLYASTVDGQLGEVVYNSSVLMPNYILEGLLAGTTYYITLGACTGGGCTLGPAASARTEESAPDGVGQPLVKSPSPSELLVTWKPPQFPNGAITRYDLLQNGVQVYTGLLQSSNISNLEPYSRHVLRLRACTAQGCAMSAETVARTLETSPEGLIVLTSEMVDARTVNVSWTVPEKVNGFIVYKVYFSGLFYEDPENWNFDTVNETRQLLNETIGYTVYTVNPLIPLSTYKIQVNGSNSVGFILSNIETEVMPPGTPDGMAPPELVSVTSTSMRVTWKPVGRVNANEEPAYLLQFKETTDDAIIQDEFGPTVTLSYTKTNLLPFTEYMFRVSVSNSLGATLSPWATLITKQDSPASIRTPLIIAVRARYVDIAWSPPLSPNGIISHYNIYENGNLKTRVNGNVTSYRVDSLAPYNFYTFDVEVCTIGGCTRSLPSSTVRTLEDIPEELAMPQLTALSPSAVQVVYLEPGKPNGVIRQYIIERKEESSDNTTIVATRFSEMTKTYVDESNMLSPFSVYSYRVNAQNGAGTGVGPWSQITTGSSRPAGVNPPRITSISPTSVLVQWELPLQPNGKIETYVLRFPEPRIEVRNSTQLAQVVNNLRAFTEYAVTLTVCTSGGCTESVPTRFTTNPTIPSGQAEPVPTAISQSRISILWQPPASPNGPNVRYELSRMKIKQPLDATASDIGVWQSAYNGVELFYEDINLPMFTTYIYRITVFNDIGQSTGPNSTQVTTFGGLPRLSANVSAEALDHLSIFVNWTLPGPVELQGEVQTFTLQAISDNNNVTEEYPPTDRVNYTIGSLQPNTEYSVVLKVTIYGGASISSEPVMVTTLDGAPTGLNAPTLSVVSNTELRVSWTAPSQPNGEIVSYSILVNDRKIDTGSNTPGSAVVGDLQPYTVYNIRIEACTVFACSTSSSTYGTTAEALPQGVSPPVLRADSPTQVTVAWKIPDLPNGIIQRYDLWRKTLKSCAEVPAPTVNPEFEKCTFIECSILENLCGTTCYSGPKVCCSGMLHDAKPGFACCGTEYVVKPNFDDVCCYGKFYEPKTNFKCCGQRYIEVLQGDTCCADTIEDRVSISKGDKCCGSIPYDSSGAQICCQGTLINKLGRKCCGKRVISDTTTCCGDAEDGQMYLQQSDYTCCGKNYVEADKTLCCTSDTGHSKVHYYESPQEKLVSSDKCCGLNRITQNLQCCNYVGYNQLTQVCADRSNLQTGCGTGTVCPLSQQNSAYCDRCNFDTTAFTCGSITGYLAERPTTPDPSTTCTTEMERIYSGLETVYVDSDLTPYSQYEYSVVAVNSAGTTTSSYSAVRTLEAVPEMVSPPSTRVAPGELFAFYLTWTAPEKPNGIITGYTLRRDGIELYSGMAMNFTDDLNILPYRSYSYILSACNAAGCTDSSMITVATAQAVPEDLVPPIVEVVGPTSIKVKAQLPGKPNGVILSYAIHVTDVEETYNSTSPQEFLIDGLMPFTPYTVEMVVCTPVGCSTSPNVTVTTNEDVPEGLDPPRIIVISSSDIELYWKGPQSPNGMIQDFKVIQTQPTPVTVVYSGMATNLRLTGLTAGQSYTYQLEATNGAGAIRSIPRQIIMPLVAPLNVPPPQSVKVLSSTSIQVAWESVPSNQGDIDQYRVLLNIGQETEVERGVGLERRITIPDLLPYTEYEVRLQACLRNILNGCGTSSGVVVVTLEDKPEGMKKPKLTAIAHDAVHVEWEQPTTPNGVITNYRIFQRRFNESDSEILVNQVAGSVYEFLHSGQDLKPYEIYEYKVIGINSKGQAESEWTSVRTLESPPTDLSPPVINSVSAYGVSVSWSPPENLNGPIREYKIYYHLSSLTSQEDEEYVSVGGEAEKTVLSGLEAFSDYDLYLEAVNGAGSVRSSSVTFKTTEGFPSGLSDFNVEKINTGTAVILTWDAPQKPNGLITIYRVYETGSTVAIYSGIARNFEFRRLSPHTEYLVKLEACTSVGCTISKTQSFFTAEIAPTAQPSPSFGQVNASHVQLIWSQPVNPNGVITSYEVLRTSSALRRKRDVGSSTVHFSYNDFTSYPYTLNFSEAIYSSSRLCTSQNKGLQCLRKNSLTEERSHIYTNASQIVEVDILGNENDMLVLKRNKRQTEDPQVIYRTTDTGHASYNFTDSNLKPYTNYRYSIRASNSLGSTNSPWQTVQTQQAAPEGVQPPQLSHIPGNINSILISWSPPSQMNGVLQGYQIQRNGSLPLSFPPDEDRQFIDTGLSAYTVYSYTLKVCSGGGCTTSDPATIRTIEAAPLTVNPPNVTPLNSSALQVSWSKPPITNGDVIQYSLKMDGTVIFTGLSEAFTVQNLVPYESHVFTLTVCTNGGCTESGEVTGRAEDAPPTGLSPPLLRVISSTSIEVTWSPPTFPNGIISSYDIRRDGRLIYTNSIAVSGNLLTFYTDYGLEPGEEYSYVIVARNRKGSVQSGPAVAMTYSSSPSGLSPPTVTPVSSTSLKVDWAPPSNPNGVLVNYTLYEGTRMVYSGVSSQLSYTVPGLQFYTEYSIRVEACTNRGCESSQPSVARTLPASPEGQPAPSLLALADEQGAHAGVRISWEDPTKPNGIIDKFEINRRESANGAGMSPGESVLIYNGSTKLYTDKAAELKPNHQYQYMVIAINSVGKTGSPWATITTKEAAPEGLLPPIINASTSTTIMVTARPPETPNGVVRLYRILVNSSVASSSPSLSQTVGLSPPLRPYTMYELKTQACTSGGCVESDAVMALTDSAKPTGLDPVNVIDVSSSSVKLEWTAPSNPNGKIIRYELYKRRPCPPTSQPFEQACVTGDPTTIYTGSDLTFTDNNLKPYTAYEFQIQVFNDKGGVDFPEWVRVVTEPTSPAYIQYPTLYKNDTRAVVFWGNSFSLNGRLRNYTLLADGKKVYQGIGSEYGVERESKAQVIDFLIQVFTLSGTAESPVIRFDPEATNNIGTTQAPPAAAKEESDDPFYEEIWFIVLMCILALLILFIALALCIRCTGSKEPYIRERRPLQRQGQNGITPELYVIDASDGSVIDEMTRAQLRRENVYQGPGLGVINPAFSQDGELGRISPSKLSRHSAKYLDEDDLRWGKPYDSGLFEELDDDDDDSLSGQTYSYTKEQTVFTDTHL